MLRSGARWSDLPERYGKYKSTHTRFMRRARSGVWERIFDDLVGDTKKQYLMIDSTIVRAHQQAATGRKKRRRRPGSGAFPRRSEHQDSTAGGRARAAIAVPHHPRPGRGYTSAAELLAGQQAEAVIADRGYDADVLVAQSHNIGTQAVIPPKRNRKLHRVYDRELYKQRNRIEHCFNELKHFRRFATRYCKTIQAFRSFTALACSWLRFKLYVDTP